MPKANVFNMAGEKTGEIELSEAVFGIEPNKSVLHDSVKNHLANLRQGTQSALTKGEVSFTTKKPWRQKGTGRARQGSIRAPQWRGGGTVFGPTPRKYGYRINRKVRRLALRSYLSQFVADNALTVVDKIQLDTIKTKDFAKIMKDLGADRKALFVFDVEEDWENVWMSMRNLQNATFTTSEGLSCLDMANSYKMIATEAAVKKIEEALQ